MASAPTNGVAAVKSIDKSNTLTVTDNRTGQTYIIPIWENSVDASEFKQIKTLEKPENSAERNVQGLRIFDPGFGNTAVSKSAITFMSVRTLALVAPLTNAAKSDGLNGTIQYRGYDVRDIIQSGKRFVDVCHLLWRGYWPSIDEARFFQEELNDIPLINEGVFNVIRAMPEGGSPVGTIIAGLMALQSQDMNLVPTHAASTLYHGDMGLVDRQMTRIFSSLAMIIAASYCHKTGREFTSPRKDLSTIENFFVMMGHVELNTGLPNPRYVGYFETLWILLADHEMTCSTAAMLHTASSMPDAISCLVSAISAFYGPLHGGAIEVAYKHIRELSRADDIAAKMERVHKSKERLFGYGHRVYRVPDPRFETIQKILFELKPEVEADPLLNIALKLDHAARHDEYFVKRNLNPNADLYAALTCNAMGFPPEWILPIAVLARSQGFLAHFKEAMSQPQRIWRPNQIYTGPLNRKMDE